LEEVVFRKLLEFLEEDAPYGDITSELVVPEGTVIRAVIVAKSRGVLAGAKFVKIFLERLGVRVLKSLSDGAEVEPGSIVMELEGDARTILLVERTVLNLLMHLSGVATATRRLVEMVHRVNPRARVAATRKTLPGLRLLEKYAVEVGGGDPHRFSLSDMILIKDNHIAIAGSVEEAVRRALSLKSFSKLVEVEARSVDEAVRAAELGTDIVMLDNMSPEDVRRAVEELKRRGLRDRVIVEVSGGITEDNIAEYASADVDVISTSIITMAAKPLDMSLEIVEVLKP